MLKDSFNICDVRDIYTYKYYIKLKVSEIGFFIVIIFLKTRQGLTTFELLFICIISWKTIMVF